MLAFSFTMPSSIVVILIAEVISLLAMTALLWLVHRWMEIPRRRRGAGHCPRCDYDLRFNGLARGCPECGWRRRDACGKSLTPHRIAD